MLTIRMKRVGRKGHAQFRLVVQDSRFSPSSGRVVAYLGSYDPHTKTTVVDKDKAKQYLANGAQPSERISQLLKSEGLKLPSWVSKPSKKKRAIRNPEKLRSNRPVETKAQGPKTETADKPTEEPAEAAVEAEPQVESPPANTSEAQPAEADSEPAAEPTAEKPAGDTPSE